MQASFSLVSKKPWVELPFDKPKQQPPSFSNLNSAINTLSIRRAKIFLLRSWIISVPGLNVTQSSQWSWRTCARIADCNSFVDQFQKAKSKAKPKAKAKPEKAKSKKDSDEESEEEVEESEEEEEDISDGSDSDWCKLKRAFRHFLNHNKC